MLKITQHKKPPVKQAAFSLLELIVVIVIIGILVAYTAPRMFSKDSFDSRAAGSELISHLRLAQQLAMNHTLNTVTVAITATTVDVQSNGASLTGYPINFANLYDAQFSAANFTYTSLGETTGATISITPAIGVSVCVENSGFAWLC